MTLYLEKHYTLKILHDENFFDYDNLKSEQGILNNNKDDRVVTFVFYKYKNCK